VQSKNLLEAILFQIDINCLKETIKEVFEERGHEDVDTWRASSDS